MRHSPRAGLLLVLIAGCGSCGDDDGSVRPPVPDCGAATRFDSGLTAIDAASTRRDGWIPTVTHFDVSCADWPRTPAAARPTPGSEWRVAWRWIPDADPTVRDRTDFLVPTLNRSLSPAVTTDRVYVVVGDAGAGVAGLSRNGRLLWGRQVPNPWGDPEDDLDQAWLISPPVATPDGGVLIVTNRHELVHYNQDGEERWRLAPGLSPFVGFGGAGRNVALGPQGRIYWAPVAQPVLFAIDRCGQVVWRADAPAGQPLSEVLVGADGVVFVHAPDAVFRVAPNGEFTRLYTNPLNFENQPLRAHGIYLDGTLHLSEGNPRDQLVSEWGFATRIDPTNGTILDEVRYRDVAGATDRGGDFEGTLEPFGFLETMLQTSPERVTLGIWHRGPVETRFQFPAALTGYRSFERGFVRVGCDAALLLPDSALPGIVLARSPGEVEWRLPDDGPFFERGVLHPSGLLVITGPSQIVAVQTDGVPGPGWSHYDANAWNSNSLAVEPH